MKLNENGFSLAEITIGMGLLGLVGMGAMHLMQGSSFIQKKADTHSSRGKELIELSNMISQNKKNIAWDDFDFSETYFKSGMVTKKVAWDLNKIAWATNLNQLEFEVTGEAFLRSSHSLEVPQNNGKKGIIFSRCIEADEINTEYDVFDAFDLSEVPMVKVVGNSPRVYCCPRGSNNVCKNEIISNSSDRRVRTYLYKNGRLKTYPLKSHQRTLKGTGFFLTFNSELEPKSYEIVIFNQSDPCVVGRGKSCDKKYIIKSKTVGFSVKQRGIQDSGFIEMN